MSIQTASFFVLLGLSLVIRRTRQDLLGNVLEALIAAAVLLVVLLVAAQVFGAAALFGQSSTTRTSPQTLVCLALLAFVQACRRARYGYFSVFVGVGIGSHIARIALPMSLVLVFLLMIAGEAALARGYVTLPYAAALTASSMAAILCFLVVLLSRRINELERALRDMSLTDELTGLHNRRGFYLLGEQALRNSRRDKRPVTVLFVDADGLKKINDTLGHDVGSELLRDIGDLLRKTFRSSDVVGRLGGDEFAVITGISQEDLPSAVLRLNREAEIANGEGDKPYPISFSTGGATAGQASDEPFAALVERADAAMYQDKRQRRAARDAGGVSQPPEADAASRRG
jgi:diguanylate cyclase (GGDEF)-like protein